MGPDAAAVRRPPQHQAQKDELAHLRHRGHGPDYWRAVRRVMPDYERRRDELRRYGPMLTW